MMPGTILPTFAEVPFEVSNFMPARIAMLGAAI